MNAFAERTIATLAAALISVAAVAAEPSGADIMQAVYERPQGKDLSGLLTMTLVDARAKERVRSIK